MKQSIFFSLVIGLFLISTFSSFAQWVPINGTSPKNINDIVECSGYLIAATNSGIYRSSNDGETWDLANVGLNGVNVKNIFFDNELLYAAVNGDGIYVSNNLGDNWELIFTENSELNFVQFVKFNNVFVAAVKDKGMLFSNENATSWQYQNDGLLNLRINGVCAHGATLYIVTDEGGVYKRTPNDNAWVSINSGLAANRDVNSIVCTDSSIIISSEYGVYASYNDGLYWIACNEGLDDSQIKKLIKIENRIYGCYANLGYCFSDDNGMSWIDSENNLISNSTINNIIQLNSGLFSCTTQSIYKSVDDGQTWNAMLSSGLSNLNVRGLTYFNNKLFAATYGGDVYKSLNLNGSWVRNNNGLTTTNAYLYASVDSLLFLGTETGLFRTSNDGETWECIDQDLNNKMINCTFVISQDSILVGTRNGGVYFTYDKGAHWRYIGLDGSNVLALVYKDNILIAGTRFGTYRSYDFGQTWEMINGYQVNTMTVYGDNIYAGTLHFGVFRFNAQDSNWISLPFNFYYYYDVNTITLSVNGKYLYAGTVEDGLYISQDYGQSWDLMNEGFDSTPSVRVITYSNDEVFVGTDMGVYKQNNLKMFALTEVTEENTTLPDNFIVEQNYPNPFNPSTTISFSLPTREYVKLKIFDSIGKEVATLMDEEVEAGKYQKVWDASNLASGVYFYNINAGSFNQTKKMLLVK